jgi:hypothetical protein
MYQAIVGALGGILKLAENPLIAWLLVASVLLADAGLISGGLTLFGFANVPIINGVAQNGLIGETITFIVNVLGLPIVVSSFNLLIVVGIMPVFLWALSHGVSVGNK